MEGEEGEVKEGEEAAIGGVAITGGEGEIGVIPGFALTGPCAVETQLNCSEVCFKTLPIL